MWSLLKERLYKFVNLRRTGLFVIVFGCVMIGATFAIIRQTSSPGSGLPEGNSSSRNSMEQALKFRSIAIFDGTREGGIQFSNEVYKTSDCSTVIKGVELFNSPASAAAELERQLNQADKVLTRGLKFGITGQPTEKVKLAFKRDSNHKQYSILWTENSELHSIGADSLQNVEEFENWLTADNKTADGMIATEELTFLPGSARNGTEEGVPFFEQQFRSDDCVTLSTRIEYLGTRGHAEELLQRKIQSAVQLIEREPKTDAAGQHRGERVVFVLAPERKDEFQHKFVVMWTQDSELHSITAPILNYVLEFEKRYYPPNAAQ